MLTNELKKGDCVGFNTGGWGQVADNVKGDVRSVLIGNELVRVHSYNIISYRASDGGWYSIDHSPVQRTRKAADSVIFGEFKGFGF